MASHLISNDTKQMQSVGMSGLDCEDLAITGLGLGQSSRLLVS
jgi:hypothetical protein